jgi:hypothetical protein
MRVYKTDFKLLIFLLGFLFLTSSCVPQSPNSVRSSTGDSQSTTTETPDAPTFEDSLNFFEYSNTKISSVFSTTSSFDDNLYFKGQGVNTYVGNNPSTVYCAIAHFPTLTGTQNLIVAGFARSQIDFTSGSKENFISLNYKTIDKNQNTTFCNNAAVTAKATALGGTNVYDLDDLCPTCSNISHQTDKVLIVDNFGNEITSLSSTGLGIKVTFGLPTGGGSSLCSSDSECGNVGLDCCLAGQCVKDGTLKRSYTAAEPEYNDYIAALIDVAKDELNKKKYPNFYYICGDSVTPTDPTPDPNELTPEEKAQQALLNLKYLYDCTTPSEGEMSICTVRHSNAKTSTAYTTVKDDRDFSTTYTGTKPLGNTISEVIYQEVSLYKDGAFVGTPGFTFKSPLDTNDNFIDTMEITLTKAEDTNNKYKDLLIRYRIDGSCKKINSVLATCEKYYVQGQNDGKTTDHFPASNRFSVPTYIDSAREIIVEVDDTVRTRGTYWNFVSGAPGYVEFTGASLAVQDTQKVKITYYVNLGSYPVLDSKQTALEEIGKICNCPNNDCSLVEVKDDKDNVINYECSYPPPVIPDPPLQQQVMLSSKTAPHRHFDTNGVARDGLTLGDILANPNLEQEGSAFEYTNNDLSKPNNASSYIGFNEIYGSFTYTSGKAVPAKEVVVKKGTTYDISVDDGIFSSCFSCGADYYSNLAKIFPDSFTGSGGGYKPDLVTSSKFGTTNFRADDLAFGRSCFVPATMLAWSHTPKSDRQSQRMSRLSAQHFLMSNGYNRDWYGFDYGSVIGSFDGVRWFSVGTKRRIKAESNKLFLAINAYFSALTQENTYKILIQDSIINGTQTFPTTDFESDGAECQQVYACEKDSDCASALGWDYACETVTSIKSSYPNFDDNAIEIPNEESIERLISLNGSYSGTSKRCVYRGKGAACTQNYGNVNNVSNAYSGILGTRTHGCSHNNYCQRLSDAAAPTKFNNSINRYGNSILIRNTDPDATVQVPSFGLQAPIIGRPKEWIGTEEANVLARGNLSANGVQAICIPGKAQSDIAGTKTFEDLMDEIPTNIGDVINGMGQTGSSTTTAVQSYLSQCPTFNTNGNYVSFESPTSTLATSAVKDFAASQSLSTQFLDIFDSLLTTKVVKDLQNNLADSTSLHQNSCMRAPGSTCHTDFDCAPSDYVAKAIKSISTTDIGALNEYELLFWQQELVCSQPDPSTSADFDVRKNRCCRETNKKITIPTVNTSNVPENDEGFTRTINLSDAAGTDVALNQAARYSGNSVSHYDRKVDNKKDLVVANNNACTVGSLSTTCKPVSDVEQQYETLTTVASRTCCSENWVRDFSTERGGGHDWRPEKMQQVSIGNLECLNYIGPNKNCADPDNFSQCDARSVPEVEALDILKWVGSFDLTGIPNVAIKDPNAFSGEFACQDNPTNIIPALVDNVSINSAEYRGSNDNEIYLKATDQTNFNTNIKQVFSKDTFSCCMPTNTQMNESDDPSLCCSGFINPNTNKCAMRNYTDLTVYLNRYVSSEAKDLPSTIFDRETGFIKDSATVIQVACEKKMCASGFLTYGIAYGKYKYKNVNEDVQNKFVNRYIENETEDNFEGKVDLYREGLKWNSHVYCVPEEVGNNLLNAGIPVFQCN